MGMNDKPARKVDRVQTGVRIEKRLLKILKSVAAFHDLTVSDLLEGMILHDFEGKSPLYGLDTLALVEQLRGSCNLDLRAEYRHRLTESPPN
jgi:hypothetical protein